MKIIREYHCEETEELELTDELLETIADWNGSPVEKVREWLEAGRTVHTSLSTWKKA